MNGALHQLHKLIDSGTVDDGFVRLYGKDGLHEQKQRYRRLLAWAKDRHANQPALFVSAPGRTELGGNHTDHNNGRVLAASVDLDCVALVSSNDNKAVDLYSGELDHHIKLDLNVLEPQTGEHGTPESLVRGVAAAFQGQSCKVGGVTGIVDSTCKPGNGLSSSAAFSVLVGAAFAHFYADAPMSPIRLAHFARYAENVFFGKPCGLMDQLSSAVGEVVAIDFKNPEEPVITRIAAHFDRSDFQLVIIETGSSHAELTPEYAAIPDEIEQALQVFGKTAARGLSMEDIFEQLPEIRSLAGDRALLRLMHFVCEDQRAQRQAEALQQGRFTDYLALVKQSGASSCNLLQNCVPQAERRNQGVLLALALTAQICPEAVCRVHGGGFAGTIQAYIPKQEFERYKLFMTSVFGDSSVLPIKTGRPGISLLSEKGWYFPTDEV